MFSKLEFNYKNKIKIQTRLEPRSGFHMITDDGCRVDIFFSLVKVTDPLNTDVKYKCYNICLHKLLLTVIIYG